MSSAILFGAFGFGLFLMSPPVFPFPARKAFQQFSMVLAGEGSGLRLKKSTRCKQDLLFLVKIREVKRTFFLYRGVTSGL